MPDTLNKQALINLLIDSPLREPIKINLIDIVNNTSDPDLPKIFPTITKELEIFQKATERRMKLADETIAKLGGTAPVNPAMPEPPAPASSEAQTPKLASGAGPLPPLDLPPLPTPPAPQPTTTPLHTESPEATREMTPGAQQPGSPLSVPSLDLPPLPTAPTPAKPPITETSATPEPLQPLGGTPSAAGSDEAALAEIQKELDSLKTSATADANPAPAPTT